MKGGGKIPTLSKTKRSKVDRAPAAGTNPPLGYISNLSDQQELKILTNVVSS